MVGYLYLPTCQMRAKIGKDVRGWLGMIHSEDLSGKKMAVTSHSMAVCEKGRGGDSSQFLFHFISSFDSRPSACHAFFGILRYGT